MTRIVAGTARGRRLAVPPAGTRPTSDRVREAMFSSVESLVRGAGRDWPDAVVLDLFAGSGALGLEAASRGARTVTCVERDAAATRVIAANAAAVGCPGVEVVRRDARRLPADEAPAATLVFADPPYSWPAADLAAVLARLVAIGRIATDALVVAERPANDRDEPFPPGWSIAGRRRYGDSVLWYGHPGTDTSVEADEGA